MLTINLTSHEALKTERQQLMLEAEKHLKKIVSLNSRYNNKLVKLRKRLEQIESIIGE